MKRYEWLNADVEWKKVWDEWITQIFTGLMHLKVKNKKLSRSEKNFKNSKSDIFIQEFLILTKKTR